MARRSKGLDRAVQWANDAMLRDDITPGERAWIRATIERVLTDTGTYHGFNYTAWYAGGYTQWEKDGNFAGGSSIGMNSPSHRCRDCDERFGKVGIGWIGK